MDHRISREQAMMLTAQVWSQRSTCFRRNVGAVVTIGHHIVSVGYNGSPAGKPHCDGRTCYDPKFGCNRAIHAEKNAIDYMPELLRTSSSPKSMYTTESPCPRCAEMILAFGFTSLYYLHEYRILTGIKVLIDGGLQVYRMTPAGMIMQKHLVDGELSETIIIGEQHHDEQHRHQTEAPPAYSYTSSSSDGSC